MMNLAFANLTRSRPSSTYTNYVVINTAFYTFSICSIYQKNSEFLIIYFTICYYRRRILAKMEA